MIKCHKISFSNQTTSAGWVESWQQNGSPRKHDIGFRNHAPTNSSNKHQAALRSPTRLNLQHCTVQLRLVLRSCPDSVGRPYDDWAKQTSKTPFSSVDFLALDFFLHLALVVSRVLLIYHTSSAVTLTARSEFRRHGFDMLAARKQTSKTHIIIYFLSIQKANTVRQVGLDTVFMCFVSLHFFAKKIHRSKLSTSKTSGAELHATWKTWICTGQGSSLSIYAVGSTSPCGDASTQQNLPPMTSRSPLLLEKSALA